MAQASRTRERFFRAEGPDYAETRELTERDEGIIDTDGRIQFPDEPRSDLEKSIAALMEDARKVLHSQGRLRNLLQANHLVVEELDLDQVLGRIVDAGIELVGARYGALGVLSPDGGHLEQFIHSGMSADDVANIGHLPEGLGILGAVIEDAAPIRLQDLSSDPRSAGFPAHHPAMDGFLGVPIRVRGEVFGNLYLTSNNGQEFTADDEELIQGLAVTAGAAIANARLYDDSTRRQRWASALAEVTAALLATDSDGDNVLVVVADRVAALMDADRVCVIVPHPDADTLRVAVARGRDASKIQGHVYSGEGTVASRALQGGYAVSQDEGERFIPGIGARVGPALAIPLMAAGRPLGVLSLSRPVGGPRFSAPEVDMASEFGTHASVAIELAHGRADSRTLELVEERARIARDLHDHVIQRLFSTGLTLQGMAPMLPEMQRQQISDQIDSIDAAISDIRTAIFTLSTQGGAEKPKLRHAILDIVTDLSRSLLSTPRLTFQGPVDTLIVGDLADDVTAVVREALSNVARHAHADNCSVTVTIDDEQVHVVVEDDGRGMSDGTRSSGTANLAERAVNRGGHFALDSREPHGTRATWSVPLPEDPA